MRLAVIPSAAVLLLVPLCAASPAAASPTAASAGSVHITAVVRDASGHLTFRRGRATDVTGAHALASRWRREKGVIAASVDHRIRTTGAPDPLGPTQWGLTTLRATEVGTATGEVVGIVDTGVDGGHPDLAGVVLPGTDIVAPGGDGRTDPNGHGTHVAGIVAAIADNGIGGAGLAQGAQILPVRVMQADGTGWDSDAAKGVAWAADHGANVVNLSFGGPDPSPVMDAAVSYAMSKGVSVVVAAGNEGDLGNPVEWPAADPGVIAVGAVDAQGRHPLWSNTGNHVAVVAPGVRILSTLSRQAPADTVDPTDPPGYAVWDGTSMAAPFVSAAVALLRHAQPTLTVAGVRQRLMQTADDLGPVGFDTAYGAGRVDVLAAEGVAAPIGTTPPAPVTPFYTSRISATRTSIPYVGAVTISTRVLAGGFGMPDVPLVLQRLVGTSWVETRTGITGEGGLASWVLHPDRTTYYRAAGEGWTSALVRIVVTPTVSLRASTTTLAGRVLPGAATTVRIDRRVGTGWVTLTTIPTLSDGNFRQSRRIATGTLLRAVAYGVASPAVKAL